MGSTLNYACSEVFPYLPVDCVAATWRLPLHEDRRLPGGSSSLRETGTVTNTCPWFLNSVDLGQFHPPRGQQNFARNPCRSSPGVSCIVLSEVTEKTSAKAGQ